MITFHVCTRTGRGIGFTYTIRDLSFLQLWKFIVHISLSLSELLVAARVPETERTAQKREKTTYNSSWRPFYILSVLNELWYRNNSRGQ